MHNYSVDGGYVIGAGSPERGYVVDPGYTLGSGYITGGGYSDSGHIVVRG